MECHGLEMVGPIRSSDGVDAIEIEAGTGKVTLKNAVEIDGNTQLDGTFKLTSGTPGTNRTLESDGTGGGTWQYRSVPSGETILFYKSSTVLGYSLHASDFDDDVVYIAGTAAAGGNTGGGSYSGSTWTISGMANQGDDHNHQWYNYVSKGDTYSWAINGSTPVKIVGASGDTTAGLMGTVTLADASNPTTDLWTQDTAFADSIVHTPGWRPKGRTFSMQTKT